MPETEPSLQPEQSGFTAAEEYKALLQAAEAKVAEAPKPAGPTENPMARFNLNQDGQNPDWQPTPESGLPPAEELVASAELQKELKQAHLMRDPETDQCFSALFINWPKEHATPQPFDQDAPEHQPEKVLVALPQFNITTEHPPLNYLVERIALETRQPMVVMNNPSTAESADLTKEQVKALKEEGNFSSVTEPMLRALKEQGVAKIDLFGYSMGARVAASMAAEAKALGIEVENLVMLEAPGAQDLKTGQMMGNFMKEGKDLGLYQKHPHDPRQLEASGVNEPAPKQLWNMAKGFIKAFGRRGMYTAYPKAMAQPTLPLDTLKALQEQSELKVTLINGGASKISPTPANNAVEQFLDQQGYKERTRRIIFSGESHPLGEGAKRMGHLVKTALRKS